MSQSGAKRPYDELILSFLENEATPEEEKEFRDRMVDELFCQRVAEYAIDLGHLYDQSHQGMLHRLQANGPVAGARRRQRALVVAAVTAASFLLVTMAAWWLFHSDGLRHEMAQHPDGKDVAVPVESSLPPAASTTDSLPTQPRMSAPVAPVVSTRRIPGTTSDLPAVIAVVENVSGQITTRATLDTEVRTTIEGRGELRSGNVLETMGPDGFAVLKFTDGSAIAVAGETQIVCSIEESQKRLNVLHGDIMAQVVPQSAKAMVIKTPTGEAEVVGTRLSLFASLLLTELAVHEGHVRLRRFADNRVIDVRQGKCAVASREVGFEAAFEAEPIEATPSMWEEDFEEEWPSRWRAGHWIHYGLPAGSSGAVLAAPREEEGPCFISTPNEWSRGLFRIEDDTHLNMAYKVKWPGWFYIMVETRSEDYSGDYRGHYMFQTPGIWKIPRNEWQTISIPLGDFHEPRGGRPDGTTLSRPNISDVVFSLFLRTQVPDPGLVVDRIWVTRGVPDSVEVLRLGE